MMMNTHTFSFLSAESTALMPLFLSNIIGAKNTLKNYNVDLMQIKGPVPGIVGLVAYSKAEVENISPYSLPSFKGCVEIKSLMVSPGCEKKGYGTNLINRVLNQTSKDVCINIKNQDQIPFFKKKGFEIISKEEESCQLILRREPSKTSNEVQIKPISFVDEKKSQEKIVDLFLSGLPQNFTTSDVEEMFKDENPKCDSIRSSRRNGDKYCVVSLSNSGYIDSILKKGKIEHKNYPPINVRENRKKEQNSYEVKERKIPIMDKYLQLIASGEKSVEGRINSGQFKSVKIGDTINFFNQRMPEGVNTRVVDVKTFFGFKQMIEYVGIDNILPGCRTIEEGVRIYESIPSFAKRARENGVVAIFLSLTNRKRKFFSEDDKPFKKQKIN